MAAPTGTHETEPELWRLSDAFNLIVIATFGVSTAASRQSKRSR